MVNQGHEVKLYCRNSSIHKFDRALEKGGFDFNNEGHETFVPLQILVMIFNMC